MSGAKYWDESWNPVVGCRKVSEGCENCYAERTVERFGINRGEFAPTVMSACKPSPKRGVVFAGNMTDLFGEWNTESQIIKWLGSMEHYLAVNLILTKRAERMANLLRDVEGYERIISVATTFRHKFWFGVTAENQKRANERIPQLLQAPALKKWLSLEPLLGEIEFSNYLCDRKACNDYGLGACDNETCPSRKINWVVVGAESGPKEFRRPCKIEWVEHIVEQCRNAGVPVFVKQLDLGGKLVTDINKFPKHLQIRELPW